MIPGFGLLRRTVTLALMGSAFWAGMQAERFLATNRMVDRCQDGSLAFVATDGSFHPDCEGSVDAFYD